MKVVTCDETGLVKTVSVERTAVESKWRKQSRAKASQRMCFAHQSDDTVYLGLATKKLEKVDFLNRHPISLTKTDVESFAGLAVTENRIVTCCSTGQVTLRDLNAPSEVVATFKGHVRSSCMKLGLQNKNILAMGGKDADLRIWDVNSTDKQIFKAKNVKNNRLNLQVPVHIRDVAFMPNSDDRVVVTVSAHKHFRIYDSRVKQRPIFSTVYSEAALNCVALTNDGRHAITGDALGHTHLFDMRARRSIGKFHGPVGAVRSVSLHPVLPFVAVGGLDRHVRVYDVTTRQLMTKVFLKQRIEHVLFTSEDKVVVKDDEEEEEEAAVKAEEGHGEEMDEDDVMWAALASANVPKKAKMEPKKEEEQQDDDDDDDDDGGDDDDDDEDDEEEEEDDDVKEEEDV
ncbi:hypothetical protein PTSG_12503 [Salpingoeca rosetta]|uniref:Uncharacterized protein n=1 Tax=Salpingoeca rosetta (strain ATCC 50818 / BSB-021) TaxID=946362 RepID=F2UF40_SALR5|nr:uncharacterized protein PTSG_12503 [Salpingoeca rosetta]EGD75240.1 hypothetical protein PTSG_12503 [Salpingoeca rosetta]|eukprot:XP_004992293.1 hypothetical protein PTSG_12503 [Salpingoeca rosetta]